MGSLDDILELLKNNLVKLIEKQERLKGIYYTECTDIEFNKSEKSQVTHESEVIILNCFDRKFCQKKLPIDIQNCIFKYIDSKHPKIQSIKVVIQQMVENRC